MPTPFEKSIPLGICHCGCGGKTTIATRNHTKYGMVKGQPRRFMLGHKINPRLPEDAAPFKIDGVYCRLVPLTKGLHAIVDADDYLKAMRISWQAASIGHGAKGFYAADRNGTRMQNYLLDLPRGEKRDHINRVGIDNRRKNLRPCEQRENAKNASRRSDNTSGFIGVWKHNKKFASGLQADGKKIYLGVANTIEGAARKRDAAALQYHGDFAVLNFPSG